MPHLELITSFLVLLIARLDADSAARLALATNLVLLSIPRPDGPEYVKLVLLIYHPSDDLQDTGPLFHGEVESRQLVSGKAAELEILQWRTFNWTTWWTSIENDLELRLTWLISAYTYNYTFCGIVWHIKTEVSKSFSQTNGQTNDPAYLINENVGVDVVVRRRPALLTGEFEVQVHGVGQRCDDQGIAENVGERIDEVLFASTGTPVGVFVDQRQGDGLVCEERWAISFGPQKLFREAFKVTKKEAIVKSKILSLQNGDKIDHEEIDWKGSALPSL